MRNRILSLLVLVVIGGITLASCGGFEGLDSERAVVPGDEGGSTSAASTIVLDGTILDGRDLNETPVQGTVRIFAADGTTQLAGPVTADAGGAFSIEFETAESIVIADVRGPDPFLPMRRAFRIVDGAISFPAAVYNADETFCLSGTYLSGSIAGSDGLPATTDIWVKREDVVGQPTVPYEVCNGRDFNPPVPAMGLNFGVDADALGNFVIPIRVPDANFELVLAMDRNPAGKWAPTVPPMTFVTAGENNAQAEVTLNAP